ncbi:oxygenase MpaB family protein [Nocardia sp. NPDC052254]|uniref:oxygenase MpaB family protein n=1 Tax=Nocardia sp. NPDC052254 TaxID=3155681 RepID=UPI00341F9E43
MTCPVAHETPAPDVAAVRPHGVSAAVERFERFGGSVFAGLFGVGLYDQTMLPAVSAALEATGRIRNEPWGRARRTAASDQLIFHGEEADRLAESRRLLRLHRDVKGVSPDGIRYSALAPEAWNWILYSSFFVQYHAYRAVTGDNPADAENQAIWDCFRARTAGLHLPGRSKPIDDFRELVAHYDTVVAGQLRRTPTLAAAIGAIDAAPRPDFLPPIADPVWRAGAPLIRHVIVLLGCGIMHPRVRELMPYQWTGRHDREFRALTTLLRVAYRGLPAAVTDTALARNRRRYRKLAGRYRGMGLATFVPDPLFARR